MRLSTLILFFLVTGISSVYAQKKKKESSAKPPSVATQGHPDPILFSEILFDFGKIPQGRPVTHVFRFQNYGFDSLRIENVQTSCGCTTPEYSKNPIIIGNGSEITVGYNAATEGYFEKSINVQFNKGSTKQLIIKGTVWKTPDQSVPGNQALKVFQQ
jgi:hypothetical protein